MVKLGLEYALQLLPLFLLGMLYWIFHMLSKAYENMPHEIMNLETNPNNSIIP